MSHTHHPYKTVPLSLTVLLPTTNLTLTSYFITNVFWWFPGVGDLNAGYMVWCYCPELVSWHLPSVHWHVWGLMVYIGWIRDLLMTQVRRYGIQSLGLVPWAILHWSDITYYYHQPNPLLHYSLKLLSNHIHITLFIICGGIYYSATVKYAILSIHTEETKCNGVEREDPNCNKSFSMPSVYMLLSYLGVVAINYYYYYFLYWKWVQMLNFQNLYSNWWDGQLSPDVACKISGEKWGEQNIKMKRTNNKEFRYLMVSF